MFEVLAQRFLSYTRASFVIGWLLVGAATVAYGLQVVAAYTLFVPRPVLVAGLLYLAGGLVGYLFNIRGIPLLNTTIILLLTFLWAAGAVILVSVF